MEETKQNKSTFNNAIAEELNEEVSVQSSIEKDDLAEDDSGEAQESETDEAYEDFVEGATKGNAESDTEDLAEENIEGNVESNIEGSRPEMTDEELDRIADAAIEALRGILAFFDAEECAIDEYEGDEGELILDVVGEDLAVLIGRYGKTLDALQYLVSSIASKKIGYHYPIAVDIEGYRNRRRQKLETLAKSAAARCIRSKTEVRLRPMTPYERRIVHIILRDESRVETVSEGEDPQRLIVVKPR